MKCPFERNILILIIEESLDSDSKYSHKGPIILKK